MKFRVIPGVIALALFVWMIVLFVESPTITYGDDDSGASHEVSCGSLLGTGWPSRSTGYLLDSSGGGLQTDDIGVLFAKPLATREGIARDCEGRRASNVGFIGLLSVPVTLLAGAALWGSRRAALKKGISSHQDVGNADLHKEFEPPEE